MNVPLDVVAMLRDCTKALLDRIPAGVGFVLITVDAADDSHITFSSNIERPDAIVAMHEMIGRLKEDLS